MPEKIAGLPAHPLIIHLPIILGPVVGLLTLLLLVPKLREKLLIPTAALSVLFAASAIAAVISGENFLAVLNIGEAIKEHADAARTLRLLSIILAALLMVFALVRNKLPALASTAMALVVAVVGVSAIGFTVKTGHEGASLVWKEQFDAAEGAQKASEAGTEESDGSEDAADASSGAEESAEDMDMSPEDHDAMQGN